MEALEGGPLVKKTLVTVAAMVGACVLVVGTISLLALLVVGRAVRPADADTATSGPTLVPADKIDHRLPAAASAKPPTKSDQI